MVRGWQPTIETEGTARRLYLSEMTTAAMGVLTHAPRSGRSLRD